MLQVELPPDLFEKVEHNLPTGGSVDEFVRDAVEYRLAAQARRAEFFRLSDLVREAMHKRGLTEDEILADFDRFRKSQVELAVSEFDGLCEEVAIDAPGTHLTRDQLHERN